MAIITVGIGYWAVSVNPEDIIKTYALGSCVAVCIYDCKRRIAGLLHAALPESSMDKERTEKQPGYFCDSGVYHLIEEMKGLGATRSSVWVKLAGGASVIDMIDSFDIGKRNVIAVRKALWKSSLGPIAEDVGGSSSRTVSLAVGDGATTISSGPRQWLI